MHLMERCIFGCAISAVVSVGSVAHGQQQSATANAIALWDQSQYPQNSYQVETIRSVTDSNGASVSIKLLGSPANASANVSTSLATRVVAGRRVRFVGEATMNSKYAGVVSVYVRIGRGSNPMYQADLVPIIAAVSGASGSTEVAFLVPADANNVTVGVLARGECDIEMRNLRVEIGPLISADTPTDPVARSVIEKVVELARTLALKRSNIDWASFERELSTLTTGAQTSADVYPAIRLLISRLNDQHSRLIPPAPKSTAQNSATSQAMSDQQQNRAPEVRAFGSDVGYVSIFDYTGPNNDAAAAYASRAHSLMTESLSSASCGWVVDLRENGGGNMFPMLAALKPLLGDGKVGQFFSVEGPGQEWFAGRGVAAQPSPALRIMETVPVAVLTGPRTASSGEAVAIAFRGRPNTRSFGLPTAGLSTGNGVYPLADGARLVLTIVVDADRNGTQYGGPVDPDQVITLQAAPSASGDTTLSIAANWLRQQPSCKRGS